MLVTGRETCDLLILFNYFFFFFQAEDGIRDKLVTGVQTCALPICSWPGLVGIGCAVLLPVYPSTRLAAQVDRTKPPVLPPSPALQLPAVQTATLPNGLQLAVVETHKVPVVDVQVVLEAGAAHDPADLPGLATFTTTMLQQGAGRRGALEIADEAAFLGAQLNSSASYDAATVSLHVPRRRLEPALDLLTDVVLRPTFADSEVARQRELRRAQIVQLADNPVAMAGIAFPAIVYGDRKSTRLN